MPMMICGKSARKELKMPSRDVWARSTLSIDLRGEPTRKPRLTSPRRLQTYGERYLPTHALMVTTTLVLFYRLARVGIAQLHGLTAAPTHLQVEHLDKHGKAHRKVDVALGDVKRQALSDERGADKEQKRQSQHLDRRVALDKAADGARRHQHHAHRDDDRDDP